MSNLIKRVKRLIREDKPIPVDVEARLLEYGVDVNYLINHFSRKIWQ
jgi:aryl carrier-like protein|tara:strand:- start:3663 stop:3803 length:141 start_codon:yes stop_codon:yes gene_type:complete